MSPDNAAVIRDFLVQAYSTEIPVTRKVLAAVPAEQAGYAPAPNSRTALDLARHLALSEAWFLNGVANSSFPDPGDEASYGANTPEQIVAYYDREVGPALERVKALPPEKLSEIVDFYGMKMPNVMYLHFMLVHCIHHRGQLSAYLRPMGAKVPDIYGGSYDEPFVMSEAAGQ